MSTVKNDNFINRFAILANIGEIVFHIDDLARLWNIADKNTLHTTLKRYVQKKWLYRIYRGFYALRRIEKINPLLLGYKSIHDYCYISTETVLATSGIIQQSVNSITIVGAKSRRFEIGDLVIHSRQLADQYLYNSVGVFEQDGYRIATVERAVADMLYFNPQYYFDGFNLLNWKKINLLQKQLGYDITKS